MKEAKDWQSFIHNAFLGLLGLLLTIGISIMRDMSKSVDELNNKIGKVVLQVQLHDYRIQNLEQTNNNKNFFNKGE